MTLVEMHQTIFRVGENIYVELWKCDSATIGCNLCVSGWTSIGLFNYFHIPEKLSMDSHQSQRQ